MSLQGSRFPAALATLAGENWPWKELEGQGGTTDYSNSVAVFRHYEAASNQLVTTSILVCPADGERRPAPAWSRLQNTNISYLVGLNSAESRPQTILTGDRSVTTSGLVMTGFLTLTNADNLTWAKGLHPTKGTIGFADGHIEHINAADLRDRVQVSVEALQRNSDTTNSTTPAVFVLP